MLFIITYPFIITHCCYSSSHTVGEDFFIIQDGSVHVTERRPHFDHGWEVPQEHVLVTLREGTLTHACV